MRGSEKHPTQKPLDLMLTLVSAFSDPGETVLDVCAGAGTTALACRLLGRDCIAIERDRTWAAEASSRETRSLALRDHARAVEWVECVEKEAAEFRAQKTATPPALERAKRRVEDAQRVRKST